MVISLLQALQNPKLGLLMVLCSVHNDSCLLHIANSDNHDLASLPSQHLSPNNLKEFIGPIEKLMASRFFVEPTRNCTKKSPWRIENLKD
ncbi:hypothetical protein EUGRSUZ_G03153 [Eucalyptus grandis]|uniref:Uncharacterized protein n=2 Tax=Eucalyptus grandis TaxID=71139 RepID=A0ACC3K8T4_EUCGR|nr:hypothetical protein EUGRSUZ_G03153 [Eucalyptus grandis]